MQSQISKTAHGPGLHNIQDGRSAQAAEDQPQSFVLLKARSKDLDRHSLQFDTMEASLRETDDIVGQVVVKNEDIHRTPSEQSRAIREHTFLSLSITLSFEEGGGSKVQYESYFVCP